MELLFYVVPCLMIALLVVGITTALRRARQIGQAWDGGVTAQARCLRSYTRTSGGGDSSVTTTLHHVYEFITRDGRVIRFDEANGPSTVVEGDLVTVHYLPDRPERATAHAPARGKLAVGTGCVLAFYGAGLVFCVVFILVVHFMFKTVDTLLP
ncbi:DUF3592 domain-containing protein [Streptomyces anandii]|uniref:DUF3592 domain-containing protein n=1 Tax=Streptomyces anandii TaxID=285454 RepID=UPI00167559CE|nr:DUF3592 domain-containing protein [Streptomyces anandii]GGX61708.1 hypothetical protein GCM10010510_02580 [Streptomyces anandii JCM 4720]